MTDVNPRAVIGSNVPDAIDYAKEETDRLNRDYAQLGTTIEGLIDEFDAVPEALTVEQKPAVMSLIKRVRDASKHVLGLHELEKTPHLRRGQAADQFFFGFADRLLRRQPRNREGIGDILNRRLTDLDNRILAEEQERRRLEADRIRREAEEADRKARELAEKAEAERLAAERARKPERKEEKAEIATQTEDAAATAAAIATAADARATAARMETLAKPSDIMRTRASDGTLGTMQQVTYAEVTDVDKLDGSVLWQYVDYAGKEKALKAWARATDHRKSMPGADVGRRNKSQVR